MCVCVCVFITYCVSQVDENYLIGLLEKVSEQESHTTITMKRRTYFDDDEDEDDFADL